MEVEALLPEVGRVAVERLRIEPTRVLLELRCTETTAVCPACQVPSHRIHSRYVRILRDLPWRGTPVVIELQTRRFFCDNPECRRCIFSEQLSGLAARRGRTTPRLNQALAAIGLECGGEPGARLSRELGIVGSADTILRRLRALPLNIDVHPRCIGIDDFAFRRGQRYGTVVVDHESHRVVELLPQRTSESTARWLVLQPQVQIVTRDRSALYAKGITAANPEAIQVADRFHLHANLREALMRLLDRHHRDIAAAVATAAEKPVGADLGSTASNASELPTPGPVTPAVEFTMPAAVPGDVPQVSKAVRLSIERRARRLARYQRVIELRDSGMSLRAIARRLGLGRDSVTRFLRADSFPGRAKTRRRRAVETIAVELRMLWDSGIHNAAELHRRVQARGFTGSWQMVRRCVAPWRDAAVQSHTPGRNARPKPAAAKPTRISSNRLSWLLLKADIEREPSEQRLIDELLGKCEPVRTATGLALQFKQVLPQRESDALLHWAERASRADVAEEMRTFAEGLVRDWPSVKAAAELPWSNGRAEGHVNRIKLIKRKMYGRANFDLLRIRVMAERARSVDEVQRNRA